MNAIIFCLTLFGLFIKWFFIGAAFVIIGTVISVLIEDSAIRRADAAYARKLEKEREERRTKLIKPIE